MSSSPTDEELLAATPRDPQHFALVYERHAPAVLRYLLRRTGSPELAADLTAEVFASALMAAGRFKPGVAPVRAWLFTIANNKLADSWRRRRTEASARQRLGMRELVFEDEELRRVEELLDAERQSESLWSLVDDLPPEQREAVLERVVNERDYAELAQELGVQEHTVRQRVSRALARLAKKTQEESA